jgi:hypothetical protein
MQPNQTLQTLAIRTHALAEELAAFIDFAAESFRNGQPGRMRRAPYLAAKVHALEVALTLADDDDALTIANELTDLEVLAQTIIPREAPTVRPPPKMSGTFLIEVRAASTNRLLGL